MASWDGLENSDSEEVCGACGLRGLDLNVGLQKVNYVLLRGSFCHQQSRLTVLGGKKTDISEHCSDFFEPHSGSVVLG